VSLASWISNANLEDRWPAKSKPFSTVPTGRFAHPGAVVRVPGGLLSAETDRELLIDAIFAPVYYRLLLRFAPLTEAYCNQLIDQALLGVRPRRGLR
jgi:hypothetical protein